MNSSGSVAVPGRTWRRPADARFIRSLARAARRAAVELGEEGQRCRGDPHRLEASMKGTTLPPDDGELVVALDRLAALFWFARLACDRRKGMFCRRSLDTERPNIGCLHQQWNFS